MIAYSLYQIEITNEEAKRINAGEALPKYSAYLDALCKGDPAKGIAGGFYKKVATVEAEDLNGVFHVGNMGPESRIKRCAPMHSVSVGDVIVHPCGDASIVKSFGFEFVEGWKA